jgi:hypothetical protein
VEYTFQNTSSEETCSAFLNEYSITFRSVREEHSIPYSMIVEVKLLKISDDHFKTLLFLNDGHSYVLSNRFYTSDKKMEDRSRLYSTFIRVLHFHLKSKSRAVFTSGNAPGKTRSLVIASVLVSFMISFTAEFFGISLANPLIQAAVLIAMAGIVILAMNMSRWPRHYEPGDIPLEFLP